MGRFVSRIYGIILVLLALVLMFAEGNVFGASSTYFWSAVVIMGVLVLMTPIESRAHVLGAMAMGTPRPAFQWVRRWVFGILIVVGGILPFLASNVDLPSWLNVLSVEVLSGQIVLLGVGALYLLASFAKTRSIRIAAI